MFTLAWNDDGLPVSNETWRHATRARTAAEALATLNDRSVRVMRGERCAYVIDPDGTRRPPDGTTFEQRENCTKSEGGPACFCTGCRAERRKPRQSTVLTEPSSEADESWLRFLDGTL